MPDWYNNGKIRLIMDILVLVVAGLISLNVKGMINEMKQKATKQELQQKYELTQAEIKLSNQNILTNAKEIQETKEDLDDVKTLFLEEIRELRKDLKLKVDKN